MGLTLGSSKTSARTIETTAGPAANLLHHVTESGPERAPTDRRIWWRLIHFVISALSAVSLAERPNQISRAFVGCTLELVPELGRFVQ